MFLDLLSHECVLYEYLLRRRTRAAFWHWHFCVINQQLATALFGCGPSLVVPSSACSSQTACATKGMWALAKAPKHFFFIYMIHDESNCCSASIIMFIISSSLGKFWFPFYSHCQSTLWSEGRMKAFLRAEERQVLIEQFTLSSNPDLF